MPAFHVCAAALPAGPRARNAPDWPLVMRPRPASVEARAWMPGALVRVGV
jgi:hypothetical protein